MWPFSKPAVRKTEIGTWRIVKDPHCEEWSAQRYTMVSPYGHCMWDRPLTAAPFASAELAEAWIEREKLRPIIVKEIAP